MRTAIIAVGLALFIVACERPMQNENDDEAGWELLFDGESIEAWQGYHSDDIPAKWVVDEGAIHFNPDQDGAGGDIITREEYDDYELAFEWKIAECGNSGVIYRADDAEQYDSPWMTGPEFQILDDVCHPDAANGEDRVAGSNYDMHGPSEDVVRPAGEWNEARILVDSAHVEHWLNGTKIVEYELWSDEWEESVANSKWTDHPDYGTPRQGHIALQDHGDPVWFRNLRIRRL